MTRRSFAYCTSIIFLTQMVGARLAVGNPAKTTVVWSIDPKLKSSLSADQGFGKYFVRLPKDYMLSGDQKFKTAEKWQWHGALNDDGTRSVIEIWTVTLDAEDATGDVSGLGEKLLETASQIGVTDYSRGKDETGIDKETGNWVTRYSSQCRLTSSSGVIVPILAENYVWLDHGELMLATVYDAANHSKDSQKVAETAIWTVHS